MCAIGPSVHVLLVKPADWPGIAGFLGTALGKQAVNITNMSLSRENVGGEVLPCWKWTSCPPQGALDELPRDAAIKSSRTQRGNIG